MPKWTVPKSSQKAAALHAPEVHLYFCSKLPFSCAAEFHNFRLRFILIHSVFSTLLRGNKDCSTFFHKQSTAYYAVFKVGLVIGVKSSFIFSCIVLINVTIAGCVTGL